MTEDDKKIWKAVTDTVTPLGHPGCRKRPKACAPTQQPSKLDLHGMTVQGAYDASVMFLENATSKTVEIVTGRSGQIRQEFERWLENHPKVKSITTVNDGAFRIRLRV